MVLPTSPAPRWNAQLGVWEGNAAALGTEAVPDPLWIFGYGSLCWKADYPCEETFVGRVRGYRRLFAQRSTDHRGTPEAPGLVATLVSDAELEELKVRAPDEAAAASSVCGVCYRVGKDDVAKVLSELDFREKGGYTRDIVEVAPAKGDGATVRALLYTANPDNPNFFPVCITDSLNAAAQIIASAHGPSGPNDEYLFRLSDFLDSVEERDEHVLGLTARVRQIQAAAGSKN